MKKVVEQKKSMRLVFYKGMHCVWDPTKKGQWVLHVYSIANFVSYDWNDSKWSEMTPNESLCV